MFLIGIVGLITLLTLGHMYKFSVEMIGLLVLFYAVAIVSLVFAVKSQEEP